MFIVMCLNAWIFLGKFLPAFSDGLIGFAFIMTLSLPEYIIALCIAAIIGRFLSVCQRSWAYIGLSTLAFLISLYVHHPDEGMFVWTCSYASLILISLDYYRWAMRKEHLIMARENAVKPSAY
jgi:hypothetical protein